MKKLDCELHHGNKLNNRKILLSRLGQRKTNLMSENTLLKQNSGYWTKIFNILN